MSKTFVAKDDMKKEAKARGLKNYSTLSKNALKNLLELDDKGMAPERHQTKKRKKAMQKVRASGMTEEEERAFQENPLQGLTEAQQQEAMAGLVRPTGIPKKMKIKIKKPKTMKIKIKKTPKPKTMKVKIVKPKPPPIPPRLSLKEKVALMSVDLENKKKSELLKMVKNRKNEECKKYNNLHKKSAEELKNLL